MVHFCTYDIKAGFLDRNILFLKMFLVILLVVVIDKRVSTKLIKLNDFVVL